MITKITSENFTAEVIESEKPVLLDFAAPWCGPCKRVAKIIQELDQEQDAVKIATVDIEDHPDIAAKYRIISIPVLVFFKEGKEMGRIVGAKPKKAVQELIGN